MEDDLRRVQATWDALARDEDVFNAIFGWPYKPDQTVDEFLASGEAEIERQLGVAERWGLPRERGRALDFGCGAGRLTQALASRFEHAVGVDVAPGMVEAARRLNRQGERAEFVLNEAPSLPFPDANFDLVYSVIVLQHLPTELQRGYVAELARVLRPGGLLVFQAADELLAAEPLPLAAMLADVRPERDRLRLEAGTHAVLRVRVRNRSRHVWPGGVGRGLVALGGRWHGRDAGGRAYLPHDVAPGEEVELELAVAAPAASGEHRLELGMLQEHVRWFSERYGVERLSPRRSRPGWVAVEVVAAPGAPPAGTETPPPAEMHPLPRAESLAALAAAGARVLEVSEDDHAGPGWRSLTYRATRD